MKSSVAIVFFILIFSVKGLDLYAQQITVQEDPSIQSFVDAYIDQAKVRSKQKAWKVQIIFSQDRRVIENEQSRFESKFPGDKTVWTYKDPYYQLKAGAFIYKADAEIYLKAIKKEYPGAFLLQDDAEPMELIRYQAKL